MGSEGLSPLGVGSLLALEQFTGAKLLPQNLYLLRGQPVPEFLALWGEGQGLSSRRQGAGLGRVDGKNTEKWRSRETANRTGWRHFREGRGWRSPGA